MTRSVSINNKPIIEIDSSTPIGVSVSGDVTIDSSTAINTDANITNTNLDVTVQNTSLDVNVLNSSLNTNATIQNASLDVNLTNLDVNSRLPVSVDNQPTVTVGNSNLDVTLQNSSINTNATIQNTNLDVTVQNAFQYVYDMVYDGASWRFQLSDSNGKAINLSHTYYTSAEITALGASTDINLWLSAYNDSMLQYKYVGSYDDQYEAEVYLTHPSLGNGNKCLRLIFDYSTQNSVKVVQSVFVSITDWTFDNSVTGALTITLGTITSPDPSTSIGVGTDICTVAVSNSGQGSITIDLSGVSASLYTLSNVTDGITGSSLIYDPLKSYVLETASDFSGASYSHSVTITATNNLYGNTNSENVLTSGTYSGGTSWSNLEYVTGAISSANVTKRGLYSAVQPTNNKGWWPTYDASAVFHTQTDWSVSFWYQGITSSNYIMPWYQNYAPNSTTSTDFFAIWLGGGYLYLIASTTNSAVYYRWSLSSMTSWTHITLTGNTNSTTTGTIQSSSCYVNGSLQTLSGSLVGSTQTIGFTDIYRCGFGAIGMAYNSTDSSWSTYGGSDTVKIDEITTWRTALTSQEVSELYNSGTPFDPVTHSASTYLERYVRCGDTTGDGTSLYDELDNTFVLAGNSGNDYTTSH